MKIATDKQKGVSLIITFFIMIIILAVVLSISVLLYSEQKVTRNMSNSTVSYYAAESGIEKVLYYDRQVTGGNSRGLCSIFSNCGIGTTGDTSVYCCNSANPANCQPPAVPTGAANCAASCSASNCTCCSISFATVFEGRTYYTTASVYPDATYPTQSDFQVDSKGSFGGAQRGVEISIRPQ